MRVASTMGAVAVTGVVLISSASASGDDADPCACLGNTDLIPDNYNRRYKKIGYGSDCSTAWDAGFSYCRGDKLEKRNRSCWCEETWCFVSESCPTAMRTSTFEGADLWYSYTTCNGDTRGPEIQQCFDSDSDYEEEVEGRVLKFVADARRLDVDTPHTFIIPHIDGESGKETDAPDCRPEGEYCESVSDCCQQTEYGPLGCDQDMVSCTDCNYYYDRVSCSEALADLGSEVCTWYGGECVYIPKPKPSGWGSCLLECYEYTETEVIVRSEFAPDQTSRGCVIQNVDWQPSNVVVDGGHLARVTCWEDVAGFADGYEVLEL